MPRILKAYALVLVVIIALGGGYLTAPYLQLKAEVVSGRLNYSAVTVCDFIPEVFDEPTVILHLDALSFRVPVSVAGQVEANGGLSPERMNCLNAGNLTLCVGKPYPDDRPRWQDAVE